MKHITIIILIFLCQTVFSQNLSYRDLPKNPEPGKCYIRCKQKNSNEPRWEEIDCRFINYQKLDLGFAAYSGQLSEKDKKKIEKTVVRLIKKGFMIQLICHFDSKNTSHFNLNRSIEMTKFIRNYLIEQNIDDSKIVFTAKGDTMPLNKCDENVICAPEVYAKNTRTEYRLLSQNN